MQVSKAGASRLRYPRASGKTQAWEWHLEISILKATPTYAEKRSSLGSFTLVSARAARELVADHSVRVDAESGT